MDKEERKEININFGGLADVAIVIAAVVVSVWQDNPNYLWLLILVIF